MRVSKTYGLILDMHVIKHSWYAFILSSPRLLLSVTVSIFISFDFVRSKTVKLLD